MASSSSKRKTTIAKRNRERKLMERRLEKAARKDARKRAAADQRALDNQPEEPTSVDGEEPASDGESQPDAVIPAAGPSEAD